MSGTAFVVFVLPFFVGAIIRMMFLKWKNAYILSCVFAIISFVAWLWTKHLTNHGVDGTVMLWALMASEATVGSLLVGGVSSLIRKIKERTKSE